MKKLETSQKDVADDGTEAKKLIEQPRAQNEHWRRKTGSNKGQKKRVRSLQDEAEYCEEVYMHAHSKLIDKQFYIIYIISNNFSFDTFN